MVSGGLWSTKGVGERGVKGEYDSGCGCLD